MEEKGKTLEEQAFDLECKLQYHLSKSMRGPNKVRTRHYEKAKKLHDEANAIWKKIKNSA